MHENLGHPPHDVRLLLDGVRLNAHQELIDCPNLQDGDSIDIMVRFDSIRVACAAPWILTTLLCDQVAQSGGDCDELSLFFGRCAMQLELELESSSWRAVSESARATVTADSAIERSFLDMDCSDD